MIDTIEPFTIHVDDAVLDDLQARLDRTRIPDQLPDTGWEYGMPADYLADLVRYWHDTYDWRAQEARLNRFPQFRTLIDGQPVHFFHVRSRHADARPVLLLHGWPGSVVEFLRVIDPLTDPEAHGGSASAACHVVVPSLPGYGWSGPTRARGWDPGRIAAAFVTLMARLGYDGYVAQGGDWGAQVATRIGGQDAAHCAALHLNMPIATPPKEPVELTGAEQADLDALGRFRASESGYAIEQSTKPQTIGAALADSPAGLLAWIVEKFRRWSDCGGDPETVFTRDDLITNVMSYWVTGTATSSARLYWEHGRAGATTGFVDVPTGVARYPAEILKYPRAWVERAYRVTYWNDLPRGGHFAAMEQPGLFVEDLRAFLSTLR